MLTILFLLMIALILTWTFNFSYATVGTSEWLENVQECVDLYQESLRNETLFYSCMDKVE